MTPTPHHLSLKGCRTRDEVIERLRPWLKQLLDDASRRFERNAVAAVHAGDLDEDRAVDIIVSVLEHNAEALDETLAKVSAFLDEEKIAQSLESNRAQTDGWGAR